MGKTLNLQDIVNWTGRSYDWLSRKENRNKLYKRGFPKPLDLPGRPVWARDSVQAWQNAQCPTIVANIAFKSSPTSLERARNALDTRLAS